MSTATAVAHPNLALIKYWGVLDAHRHLPANGSLSITLGGLMTRTSVAFDPDLAADEFELNGQPADLGQSTRLSQHLDHVRRLAATDTHAHVESSNDFPTSAGIASSASGFAALSLAACAAAGLELDPRQLSILARKGSGSAARSIFGGFVEWLRGTDDASSYAEPFLPATHWALVDHIAVVDSQPKRISSREGHALASTSPLQQARVESADSRLDACRRALAGRDFHALAAVAELDSNLMHAVMLTSTPPLVYWAPGSVSLIHKIVDWRNQGLEVFYTLDAGATVHCVCAPESAAQAKSLLQAQPEVQALFTSTPGPGARLVD